MISHEADELPAFAVIVASPAPVAETCPLLSTVAIPLSDDVQINGVPSGVTLYFISQDSPMYKLRVLSSNVIVVLIGSGIIGLSPESSLEHAASSIDENAIKKDLMSIWNRKSLEYKNSVCAGKDTNII